MGLLLSGAAAGAGEALEKAGAQAQKAADQIDLEKMKEELIGARQKALQEMAQTHDVKMVDVKETTRQAGLQADINQDVAPSNVAARATAVNDFNTQTLPGKVAEKTALTGVETQAEIEKFKQLDPLKRKSALDAEMEKLRAFSTPEMLKAERNIALAKHIVDPSYTLIPNADGTVTTFDSKSGKSGGTLTGPDGKPIVRKDPEEMKAATAVINMANANLRVAEAAYKAAASEMDPVVKASATAEWKNAQAEAKRLTAPAYAVLYAKAGIPDEGNTAPTAAPGIVDPFKSGAPRPATKAGLISSPAPVTPGYNAPLPRTTAATDASPVDQIQTALQTPNLTVEQKAALSLKLQEAMRESGVLQ